MMVARRRYVDLGDGDPNSEPPEVKAGVTSVVLDRTHPISDLYFKKCRYKVYWGGRGGVKSWGAAEALIRLTTALPLRVLCCREYMVSIKDSSHKLLKDTIYRLGLEGWFSVTKDSIKSRVGAEFIFAGLHGNENGIRSKEGIDICLVEEAQSVSEISWRALLPTIRKAGSEVWVLFNMIEETDATYQRFVAQVPANDPDFVVHKVNFDSNPFFPEELRREMERDKARDFHLYEHIWLGMPLRMSNAVVLHGRYRVEEFSDELWRQADRLLFGADFGFADDPNTLVRFFMLPVPKTELKAGADGVYAPGVVYDLYIEYEAYGKHVELDEMDVFYAGGDSPVREGVTFDGVPAARSWPIKADAARPETISHVRARGYAMSAAEKWDGSVKDGIAVLRGFRSIVIHPRCKMAQQEARLWRFKTDPKQVDQYGQPVVLPVLIKGNDHVWDAVRYGLDGYITRGGAMGAWQVLGAQEEQAQAVAGTALSVWSRLADGSIR